MTNWYAKDAKPDNIKGHQNGIAVIERLCEIDRLPPIDLRISDQTPRKKTKGRTSVMYSSNYK